MKLYVVRHGESETNLKKCWTGWMQVSLTEKGLRDAEGIGSFMRSVSFDKVYTSDLLRAKQTALTALPGCTYEETGLLREINVGSLAGRTFEDCEREYGDVLFESRRISNYMPFGGESREIFRGRVTRFMKIAEDSKCENIAVFTHNGFLRGIFKYVLGDEAAANIKTPNCTIGVFEFENEKWMLDSWINPGTVLK